MGQRLSVSVYLFFRWKSFMYKAFRRVGEKLSLDHHSQALLLVAMVVSMVLRLWVAALGVALYSVMHFSYGGHGTFQKPMRNGRTPGFPDVVLVATGLTGIGLVICGLLLGLTRLRS